MFEKKRKAIIRKAASLKGSGNLIDVLLENPTVHRDPNRAKLYIIHSFMKDVEDPELIRIKRILEHILEPTVNVLYKRQSTKKEGTK
ncbi:MAG: hypothetical protein PHO85_05445 [Candidatus Cloacimonetes bacterium]|nr:hypothetical protein [Candidatus Cloacimonadota bacterium]MDD2506009.1 hypothetical protein [Candidatus Cloacimonadota bacterium]MDD4147945.1 hypothetical protein [Candidatus Cloacimonadota bacterium]MDD4559236.1 hypothetical protein [Candidatus Cloacimonadota bacterium]